MRSRRLLLLALIGVAAVPVVADWRQFLPRAVDNGATLELFASSEEDDNRTGEKKFVWSDDFFKEKLTLRSAGYMYHPRFLQYQIEFAGALKQEHYQTSARPDPGWRDGDGFEYKARLFLLPEHSYTAELFALRWEPLLKEQSAIEHDSVSTSHGADFRYRKKPFFFHARYSDNALESAQSSSDVERFGADGEYFKEYDNGNKLSVRAAFAPTKFSNSAGLDGRSDESLLSNHLEIGPMTLFSSLNRNEIDQEDTAASRFESDQLTWYERFTAELPFRLRAEAAYRQLDGESTYTDRRSGSARERSNLDRNLDLSLIHRLYDSLQSVYTHRRTSRESGGGESTSVGDSLGFNYNKRIPRGRVLAGVNWSQSDVESNGRTDVSNEPHPGVPVPGTITLVQPNVDPSSIAVFLRSPIAPFEVVRLSEQAHYLARSVNDIVEITVFALPPQFIVPGTFDLFVSYTLVGGRYALETTGFGHNASIELFDRLVTPYYSWVETDSDVRAGVFPGTGLDSTTRTGGVLFQKEPVRARVEYQEVDWDVSPYDAWRADIQYIGSPTPTLNLYGTAAYWRRHYPRGTSPLSGGDLSPVTEESQSISGNVQKQLYDRRLVISFGGSLSRTRAAVDTDGYSLDSSVVWRVGRVDLSAGASYYSAESQAPTVPTTRRGHSYYYLKLRRELF